MAQESAPQIPEVEKPPAAARDTRRIASHTILGSDKGVASARQLGSDRRVNMWQAESMTGVVILQPPPVPKIDHEVPWIESKAARERHRKKEEVEDDLR